MALANILEQNIRLFYLFQDVYKVHISHQNITYNYMSNVWNMLHRDNSLCSSFRDNHSVSILHKTQATLLIYPVECLPWENLFVQKQNSS